MTLTPEQLARLPKHAQRYISVLERDLAHKCELLAVGPTDSNTFSDPYADVPRPLGRDTTVAFNLGDHKYSTVVNVHVDDGVLRVQGGEAFAVLPSSTNVVHIVLVDHEGHRLDRQGRRRS